MSENAPSDRPSRSGHRRRWVHLVVVGVLLPLLAAAVLVWSVSNRQDKLDRIPVAVVNNDKILTDPQPMAAGRALTASLTDPKPGTTKLDWTLTGSKDATDGLKSGDYYAVLTIPSAFSSAIISSGTDTPVRGQVQLVSTRPRARPCATSAKRWWQRRPPRSATRPPRAIERTSTTASTRSPSRTSPRPRAPSPWQTGPTGVRGCCGARRRDERAGRQSRAGGFGIRQPGGGHGLRRQRVSPGRARRLRCLEGCSQAAQRCCTARREPGTLATDSGVLADKAGKVATAGAGVSTATTRLAGANRELAERLNVLTDQCRAQGGSVLFSAQLFRARDRAVVLALGSGLLNRLAGKVAADETAIAKGAGALARGNNQLFRGARTISSASGELSRSTTKLLTGATAAAQGASTVNDAAVELESGTEQTSSAATSLVSGSDSVSSGASSTDNGAQQLSSGLEKGAKESPTYSSSQQDALAVAVSEPVELSHSEQHAKHGNGWLLAALIAVILWLAALVGSLGVDLSAARRHALALVSSRRIAFTQALPVAIVALVQVAAVLLAMWIFQASVAEVVPFVLLTVLAAVTFSLLGHSLRLGFGGAGVMIFVLFLLLQVASLGNVIPLETAPSVLRTLNGMLPLTAYTNAASQLVSGGHIGSLVAVVLLLIVWSLGACALMVVSVKRQRLRRSSRPLAAPEPAPART